MRMEENDNFWSILLEIQLQTEDAVSAGPAGGCCHGEAWPGVLHPAGGESCIAYLGLNYKEFNKFLTNLQPSDNVTIRPFHLGSVRQFVKWVLRGRP